MTEILKVGFVYGVQNGGHYEERYLVTQYLAAPEVAKQLLKVGTPEASSEVRPYFKDLLEHVDRWLERNVTGYTHQCGIEWVRRADKKHSKSNNLRSNK